MFCSKCGNKSPAAARFCNKCGTKIINGDTTALATDNHALQPVAPLNYTQQHIPPVQNKPAPLHIDTTDYFTPPFAPANIVQNTNPQYQTASHAPAATAPAPADPPAVHPDFMDYEFYPAICDTKSTLESTQLQAGNLDIYDYPIQPAAKKAVKPEPRAIVDQSYTGYPTPPPAPQPPVRPLTVNTDFANFPPLPSASIPAPQPVDIPDFAAYNPKPAAPKPAEPMPLPMDYVNHQQPNAQNHTAETPAMKAPLQEMPIREAPIQETPLRETPIQPIPGTPTQPIQGAPTQPIQGAPTQEIPQHDDHAMPPHLPNDTVTHTPKKKNGAAIIACIAGIAILGVIAVLFLFSRDGSVTPEQLVGTWTSSSPQMGTRVSRLEFNEDGTGRYYQFDEVHESVVEERSFDWNIDANSRLNNSLWTEMAEVQISTRAGQTILRYRLESLNYWYEYRRVI